MRVRERKDVYGNGKGNCENIDFRLIYINSYQHITNYLSKLRIDGFSINFDLLLLLLL